MNVNVAWAAFKAATRGLFWSLVAWVLGAIDLKQKTARELTALYPKSLRDLCNSGFAVFRYDMNFDEWQGTWRRPDDLPGYPAPVMFRVHDWSGIPWHAVQFKNKTYATEEFRAVELGYARKHLSDRYQQVKAA